MPPDACRIEALRLRNEEFHGNVDEALVQGADAETGFAGHRGMDRVAREEVAEHRVFTVRRPAADLIIRIEVAHHHRDALGLEVLPDMLSQKAADVLEF